MYVCADKTKVPISTRILGESAPDLVSSYNPRNLIKYGDRWVYITRKEIAHAWPLVSGTLFNRDVSQIAWAARDIKTIAFPNTIREVQGYLF